MTVLHSDLSHVIANQAHMGTLLIVAARPPIPAESKRIDLQNCELSVAPD